MEPTTPHTSPPHHDLEIDKPLDPDPNETPIEPVVEQPPAPHIPYQKTKTFRIFIAISTIFIVSLILYLTHLQTTGKNLFEEILDFKSPRPSAAPQISPSPKPSPTPLVTNPQGIESTIYFLRNNEVWSVDKTEEKQLTNTGGLIEQFKYSPTAKKIAYIYGVKDPSGSNINATGIRALDLNTGTTADIYFQEPRNHSNYDYVYEIKDFSFSDDGTLLAVTNQDSLLLYSFANQTFETIVSNPIPDSEFGRGMVYAFSRPQISPSNSKIVFARGFYEGSEQVVVNIASKVVTETGYSSGNGGGQSIVTWLNDDEVLVTSGEYAPDPDNKLLVVNVGDLSIVKTILLENALVGKPQKTADGTWVAMTANYNVSVDRYALIKIDIAAGTVSSTLLQTDPNAYPGNFQVSESGKVLYFSSKGFTANSISTIFVVNLVEPTVAPILVAKDGDL